MKGLETDQQGSFRPLTAVLLSPSLYGMLPTTAKLTVRIDSQALAEAKRYAASNQTNLSRLISEFFRSLGRRSPEPEAPILRKLSGVLPASAGEEEHHEYLVNKYGG